MLALQRTHNSSTVGKMPRFDLRRIVALMIACLVSGLICGEAAVGQVQLPTTPPGVRIPRSGAVAVMDNGRAVPRQGYFLALQSFYRADYRDALRGFRAAVNSGVNSAEGRWVDSICYYTMIGECMFHMGDLRGALAQYDAAMELIVGRSGWLKRIQLQQGIQANPSLGQLPWGPSVRRVAPGMYPDTMFSQQGTNLNRVLREGGTVAPPQLYPVRVVEIMRCIGLAIHRRHQILGPIAQHRRLTQQVAKELSTRQIPANHWLQSMINVQLGLARAASGETQQAITLLQQSLSVGGRLDHPLTAMALVQLGDMAVAEKKYDLAQRSYFEATYPAAYFQQPDVLEEALRGAARVHSIRGENGVFAPLLTITQFARTQRWDRVVVASLLAASQNAAWSSDLSQANTLAIEVRKALSRSDVARGDLGAEAQYHLAMLDSQAGRVESAERLLQANMKQLRLNSRRSFQIELTGRLVAAKEISPRIAALLYSELLREPTELDWQLNTSETLVVESADQTRSFEQWLAIAVESGQVESVLMVSEMLRRHKFFLTRPLGGRILALRWLLAAPGELLGKQEQDQRKTLIAHVPDWTKSSQRLKQLEAELSQIPVSPNSPDQISKYTRVSTEIEKLVEQQERMLWQLALRPDPSVRMFPPLRSLDEVQSQLQPGQAVLMLINSRRKTHALLLSNQKQYKQWELKGANRILGNVASLMREIGNYDAKQVLRADLLSDGKWKKIAADIHKPFATELSAQSLNGIDELIVVPDGIYWYLPFELLHVPVDGDTKAIIELAKVRYSPTVGLAVSSTKPMAPVSGPRVIVQGRLFSRDSDAVVAEAAKSLYAQHARSVVLRKTLPSATRFVASNWQQLVVLDDVEWKEEAPTAWSPAQIDARKPGGSLESWIKLPWGCPRLLVFPGFRTASENGLRSKSRGDEMFLTTCSLLAAGADTVVLSRWRTGGRTSMELIREFMLGKADSSSSAAWQRSVQLARSAELDPALEPRVKVTKPGDLPSADHPFFWAGYMVIGK